jgi:uncharacterized membrane protein YccC
MGYTHAFKTGLAAAIAAALYLALNLPHGFWAVVSAVVVMQANIGASFKASWARLVGTALGAFIGACLAAAGNAFGPPGLHPGSTELGGMMLSAAFAGLGVALTGAICVLFKLRDAYRLAGVTCAIVLLVFHAGPWESALHRTIDVSIGIVVALAVTVFVLPSHARLRMAEKLGEVLLKAGELCLELTQCYQTCHYPALEISEKRDAMKQSFRDARQLLAEARTEPGADEVTLNARFTRVERVLEHVLSLDEAARSSDATPGDAPIERADEFHRQAAPEIGALAIAINSACERAATDLVARKPEAYVSPTVAALEKLNARLLDLRQAGASRKLPLEEIARFYSFVEALKALARDVAAASGR